MTKWFSENNLRENSSHYVNHASQYFFSRLQIFMTNFGLFIYMQMYMSKRQNFALSKPWQSPFTQSPEVTILLTVPSCAFKLIIQITLLGKIRLFATDILAMMISHEIILSASSFQSHSCIQPRYILKLLAATLQHVPVRNNKHLLYLGL